MIMENQGKEPLLDQDKITKEPVEDDSKKYQTTPLRWGILFSLFAVKFTQGIVQAGFAPVSI